MKWALIGYGGMGRWHVEKLRTLPEFEIAGVYDILPERREAAVKDGLTAYDSLESLLADASVELVTIATPNDLHRPIAIQAMAAGKHVISEKPVTLSSRDLQAMIDASRKYGRIFSVHQNRRWDEDFLIIKQIYDQNSLGRVFNIESRVHGSRGVPGDWRNTWLQGGGMILDWGVHMLDQLLMLVDEPVVSTFCTVSHVTNDEVDDGFKAIITFGSGLTAQVEVGTSNFINLPRWYMQGENGTAVIHDWALNGEIVKVSDWEKRDAVPVVTAAGLTKTMAPRTEETIQRYPLPKVESDVRDYYRNIARAIRGEEEQLVTHAQMMRVMRLMEACFKSAEENAVVHTRI
ncbi:MAG TPA: Gfo/Idh/MocA family oxidoreductase [Candidatus Faecivicinus avistercoris]|nr:Gfo/Idh/MocA family oxidoreductase [Candidatus Faecivicinus avistercoris]